MIDLALVLLVIAYAVSGYRQGIAVGALSLVGFVGGAVLSMWIVPPLAERLPAGMERSVVLLVAVLLFAWLGQLGGALLGGRLRERLTLPAVRQSDQVLGAVAGVIAVSLVLWFVGNALGGVDDQNIRRTVASSRLLAVIDRVVPRPLAGIASRFQSAVQSTNFPRVFEGVGPEDIIPVQPPDANAMPAKTASLVRQSVVKIRGEATACNRTQEGSGVVVSPGRVVTNAHVVAAVQRALTVQTFNKETAYPARVVLFDPVTDIAVLDAPELPSPALPLLDGDLGATDDAVVAGYPGDGGYTTVPARVRKVLKARGEDIYGRTTAVREVYSLYTTVRQGNSGGPVLTPDGKVAGIVFAQSLDSDKTGYALTMNEVRAKIQRGLTATASVGTGGCAVG